MLSAANPETTVASTYTYFNNGALKTRTDGRGTVTYQVDGLNRVTRKTYTAGGVATPEAVYCYDGKAYVGGGCSAVTRDDYAWGAMTGHGTAVSSAKLDLIHPLGVVEKSSQSVVGLSEPKVMEYEYNAGGAITKATYPSGRVVGYTVGAANRVLSVRNGTTGSDYYQSTATYGPHGGMTATTMGGFSQSWQYTSRLQVREMTATGRRNRVQVRAVLLGQL